MTVLVGGMRVLGANSAAPHGVSPTLGTNDFFVNLLDMGTKWRPWPAPKDVLEGRDRAAAGDLDGHRRRPGLRLELAAARAGRGLRQRDAQQKFVDDFVAAWAKVMNLDRFDLA